MGGDISVIGGADGPTAIFLAGQWGSLFFIAALVIMAIFYGIYFAKKIAQKRKGIQTTQLGHGKEKTVRTIEIIMSAATLLIVPAELVSILYEWNTVQMPVRMAGVVLGLTGDLIFLIAVLTMRDSWRAGIPETDRTELVSRGIYQYSRNPAFLGFDLMYIGILLMYFNWILLLFTIWAVVMLHLQILQEEKYLETVFDEEYRVYRNHTGRYFGRKKKREV
ncbi:MAG: isoprenylcysteine carboxylmethyltransferase family protein [Lachnospiraceae bacterium]|nr:isoprenylcysteine carboxylmethyltransferase family protein [Lachnospiraceae bacterium]